MTTEGSRVCSKCGIEQDLSEFYNDKKGRDGKSVSCRTCIRAVAAASAAAYVPETCTECGERPVHINYKARGLCRTCYHRWWRALPGNKEKANTHKRKSTAKAKEAGQISAHRQYGLTQDEYLTLMEKPCGICGKPSKHMDHCHKTGEVRGALCHRCNLGLGYLEGWYTEHTEAIRSWVQRTNPEAFANE